MVPATIRDTLSPKKRNDVPKHAKTSFLLKPALGNHSVRPLAAASEQKHTRGIPDVVIATRGWNVHSLPIGLQPRLLTLAFRTWRLQQDEEKHQQDDEGSLQQDEEKHQQDDEGRLGDESQRLPNVRKPAIAP